MLSKTCGVCGHTYEHELPTLDSELYRVDYDWPTCTEVGYKKYIYTYEGEEFVVATKEIPATGHTYGEWMLTRLPTKDTAGELIKMCEGCANTLTHTLPVLSTLFGDYAYKLEIDATCDGPGYGSYTYTHDGQTFTFYEEIPAKGHTFGEWTVTTAPTTGTAGEMQRACSNDPNHVEKQTLPALNATDYAYTLVSEPLCEISGTAKYSYTYGTQTFEFEVTLPALGHEYGEWTVSVVPTETTGGMLVRACSCGVESQQSVEIPSLSEGGAEYTEKETKAPTATEPGYVVYTYVIDGKVIEFTVTIPATGEPESGFPWWIILIIILVLLIVPAIVLLIILLIKRNKNDKTPPTDAPTEPTAPVEEAPVEEAPIVAAPIEEEPEVDVPVEAVAPVVVRKTAKRAGKIDIVNVGMLNANFSDGDTVCLDSLKAKGLIAKSAKRYKVLSDGELNKALTVKADECTQAAKAKIVAAGGHIEKIRI